MNRIGSNSAALRRGVLATAGLLLLLGVARCEGSSDGADSRPDEERAPAAASGGDPPAPAAPSGSGAAAPEGRGDGAAPLAFTEADLDAYESGLARETELVREAQDRALSATTAEERGAAAQAQWEDATAPEGARAAGVPLERYLATREAVNRVLETLDFQGKIAGPLEIDTTRVAPEMRERLRRDPIGELPPESAAALKARLGELVPLWSRYVELTAVAG